MIKYFVKIALIAAGGIFLTSTLQAKVKWNMPTPYGDGYFHTKNTREFAADIEKKTNGEISINVHSGASLFPSTEIFRAIRGGQAEIGELLMANIGNEDAMFNIDSIPFLIGSYGDAQRLWDTFKPELEKRLDKLGAVLLYAVPWPPQNFYSKVEIKDANFFKGKKMRAYNAITSQMADLLGAAPTTIQVPEIPQAFSTGVIDVMITSGSTGVSSQAWDFIDYYTEVQAWMPKNMIFINKKIWQKLSDQHKKVIRQAAEAAEKRGWEYSQKANEADRLTLSNNGIKVVKPSPAMMKELKKVGAEMAKDWLTKVGDQGSSLYKKYNQ
ncbi:MAG: TRAP transporter substrate-binding protein [SAR324 cluster bacterium]|nr:TRAP transporter substrate-binding protein [SAR324 cluster bacterium]